MQTGRVHKTPISAGMQAAGARLSALWPSWWGPGPGLSRACAQPPDNDEEGLVLFSYSPAEGVLSFDPDCLYLQAVLAMGKVAFALVHCDEPSMSPDGRLPFLMLEGGSAFPLDGCERLVARRRPVPLPDLSSEETRLAQEVERCAGLLRTSYFGRLLADRDVFGRWAVPHYGRKYPSVLRRLLTRAQLQRHARGASPPAAGAIDTLSALLQDRRFFFDPPNHSDARAYAHLKTVSTVLSVALPANLHVFLAAFESDFLGPK
jgi:hypothetical protein